MLVAPLAMATPGGRWRRIHSAVGISRRQVEAAISAYTAAKWAVDSSPRTTKSARAVRKRARSSAASSRATSRVATPRPTATKARRPGKAHIRYRLKWTPMKTFGPTRAKTTAMSASQTRRGTRTADGGRDRGEEDEEEPERREDEGGLPRR